MKTEDKLQELADKLRDLVEQLKEGFSIIPRDVKIINGEDALSIVKGNRSLWCDLEYGWLVLPTVNEDAIKCRYKRAVFTDLKAGDVFYYGPDDPTIREDIKWYYVVVNSEYAACWGAHGGVNVRGFLPSTDVLRVVPV
jgi:hypothetical protein